MTAGPFPFLRLRSHRGLHLQDRQEFLDSVLAEILLWTGDCEECAELSLRLMRAARTAEEKLCHIHRLMRIRIEQSRRLLGRGSEGDVVSIPLRCGREER